MNARALAMKMAATVKKLGGSIEREPGFHSGDKQILVNAPEGKHWNDGTVSQLVGIKDYWTTLEEVYEDLLERISCGLEDCDEACGHLE